MRSRDRRNVALHSAPLTDEIAVRRLPAYRLLYEEILPVSNEITQSINENIAH